MIVRKRNFVIGFENKGRKRQKHNNPLMAEGDWSVKVASLVITSFAQQRKMAKSYARFSKDLFV